MRNYSTARGLFSFIEFVAWTIVVAGVIVALAGMSAGNMGGSAFGRGGGGALGAILGALPGLALALFGLISAGFIQNARANVDTAEMTGKMLKIAEAQLQISRSATQPGFAPASPHAPSHAKAVAPGSASVQAPSAPAFATASVSSGGQPDQATPKAALAETPASNSEPPAVSLEDIQRDQIDEVPHRGELIRRTPYGCYVGTRGFKKLGQAKVHINQVKAGRLQ